MAAALPTMSVPKMFVLEAAGSVTGETRFTARVPGTGAGRPCAEVPARVSAPAGVAAGTTAAGTVAGAPVNLVTGEMTASKAFDAGARRSPGSSVTGAITGGTVSDTSRVTGAITGGTVSDTSRVTGAAIGLKALPATSVTGAVACRRTGAAVAAADVTVPPSGLVAALTGAAAPAGDWTAVVTVVTGPVKDPRSPLPTASPLSAAGGGCSEDDGSAA